EGLLFVAAEQNQADRAEDDDEQRDGGAAAVAEDVAKRDSCGHVVLLTRKLVSFRAAQRARNPLRRGLPRCARRDAQCVRRAAARGAARATRRPHRAWRRVTSYHTP